MNNLQTDDLLDVFDKEDKNQTKAVKGRPYIQYETLQTD
jgi:hypothetical protein